MTSSFKSWLKRRRHLAPEADRILPLVAAAGTSGMTRMQLGHAVRLDRGILDALLSGMVEVGVLTVAWVDGGPVYQAGVGIG